MWTRGAFYCFVAADEPAELGHVWHSLCLIGAGRTCCCAAASPGKRDAGCGNAISRAQKNGSLDFPLKFRGNLAFAFHCRPG